MGGPGASKTAARLAVFDLDGTLSRRDTFLPFVAGLLLRRPGRWWRVPALLVPVIGYFSGRLGRGELKGAVLHLLFAGFERRIVDDWASRHARSVVAHGLFTDALRALRAHLAAGDEVIVLSASPDLYVPLIGRELGVHETHCTAIRWLGDRLDGRLAGPNRRAGEKTRVLEALRASRPGVRVVAYGNSAADLDHMLRCDEAVYVNGSDRLRRDTPQPTLRWVRWR